MIKKLIQMSGQLVNTLQSQHPCTRMHDPSLSPPTSFIFFQQLQCVASSVLVGCFPVLSISMYVTVACSAFAKKGQNKRRGPDIWTLIKLWWLNIKPNKRSRDKNTGRWISNYLVPMCDQIECKNNSEVRSPIIHRTQRELSDIMVNVVRIPIPCSLHIYHHHFV